MTETLIPDFVSGSITLTGTVSDAERHSATVLAVVDGAIGEPFILSADLANGARFEQQIALSDLGIDSGRHTIDVYAIDATGEISHPVHFGFLVGTAPPTSVPVILSTKSQSVAPLASSESIVSSIVSQSNVPSPPIVASPTDIPHHSDVPPEPVEPVESQDEGKALVIGLAVGIVVVVVIAAIIVAIVIVRRRDADHPDPEMASLWKSGLVEPFTD
jgi:hypothetical protein